MIEHPIKNIFEHFFHIIEKCPNHNMMEVQILNFTDFFKKIGKPPDTSFLNQMKNRYFEWASR